MSDLIQQLQALPDAWALVAVGHDKRPYQKEWQNNPLNKDAVTDEIKSGRAKAVGVLAGPPSGGLLFVDHDGISASEVLADIQAPLAELPKSWAMTSGRDGRFQIIYKVPERYWDHIKTKKIKSGKQDEEGNNEQLELRWTGCQSVVFGEHPLTGAYYWLPGRSPNEQELAEVPTALIEQMLKAEPQKKAAPLMAPGFPERFTGSSDTERARSFLDALNPARADDYDDWLSVGMALHSVGDEALLADWSAWSGHSSKHKPGDCDKKWKSFKSTGCGLGTLGHIAKQDGWQSTGRKYAGESIGSRPAPEPQGGVTANTVLEDTAIQVAARKLEAIELLTHLRKQNYDTRLSDDQSYLKKKQNLVLRYNIFTQQVEIEGEAAKGIERYYLELAQLGYKVSKELAMDCIIQVAHENQYDPVKEYLEFVSNTVEPEFIDCLATGYLRPDDKPGTLYDEMLKRTLIAAVKRVYEPGSKHDTACVLMGDQGARKSSFWNVLGGQFFSDSLKDISSKDDLMVLHRSWIMEWAELDHITSKKHAGQIKAFLTQHTDVFRVPYGKATEEFKRRGVIVGSTNRSTGFLVDETGNRRFWVIPTPLNTAKPIDTATLAIERDAIWSGAVAAYKAGEPSFLSTQREIEVADENTDYLIDNPWLPAIESWLFENRLADITTEVLLTDAVLKPLERQTKHDQMQVADVLKNLGYEKKRTLISGKRKMLWVKIDEQKAPFE